MQKKGPPQPSPPKAVFFPGFRKEISILGGGLFSAYLESPNGKLASSVSMHTSFGAPPESAYECGTMPRWDEGHHHKWLCEGTQDASPKMAGEQRIYTMNSFNGTLQHLGEQPKVKTIEKKSSQ